MVHLKPKEALRTCPQMHSYYKSSDCPTCPICEAERKADSGFMSQLVAPARRALENRGIQTLSQLATYSEVEILALHGMGKSSLPKLKLALRQAGLEFKNS